MENKLNAIAIGHTKVINGHAVTRWTATSFEVGTWGRKTVDLKTAAREVAA